jgi:DegV family protein with EDD domain
MYDENITKSILFTILFTIKECTMSNYILSCCSTADLSKEHFESRDISYICMHFSLDGIEYLDDLGQSVPFDQFYQAMVDGAETRTSQINIAEFLDYFTSFLEQGKDILHVSLSSGISGTYQSAENAAMIARERFPEQKIYVVDSLGASSGYGLIMDKLADLRDEGMDIETLYHWTNEHKLHLHHWFFSTDLTFYVKGGRISKTAGMFGSVLSICPLLNMDHMGKLIPRAKVRTKKRVIHEIVERMVENAEDGSDYSGKCFISQSACYDDAKKVADLIEERFPKLNGKVLINNIGTTIGSHTGPGTIALFFWGKERID